MTEYTVDPIVGGPGWAVQRVGPCVLGYWTEPMNEERIRACARLYRAAQRAHGRFAVFAVFTSTPFSLESVLEERTRSMTVDLVSEFARDMMALTCVFEMPRGFKASIARASAAAVTRLVRHHVPFIFADTREQAYALARARGALDLVDEATHERHLSELEQVAGGEPGKLV